MSSRIWMMGSWAWLLTKKRQLMPFFPEDYGNEELAGQKIEFHVKLNEIREEILPELNDEFARGLSNEFETLEVLKTKIRENVQTGYEKRMEQELHEQIYQHLLEKVTFEVPDVMVDAELEQIIREGGTIVSIQQQNV